MGFCTHNLRLLIHMYWIRMQEHLTWFNLVPQGTNCVVFNGYGKIEGNVGKADQVGDVPLANSCGYCKRMGCPDQMTVAGTMENIVDFLKSTLLFLLVQYGKWCGEWRCWWNHESRWWSCRWSLWLNMKEVWVDSLVLQLELYVVVLANCYVKFYHCVSWD